MTYTNPAVVSEEVLAELTSAAYHVVLRHGGVPSPFIDVELDLWRELRRVLHAGAPVDRPHVAPVGPESAAGFSGHEVREPTMTDFDAGWLQDLDEYAAQFRDAFRRRDQARWAAVYLQGLLRHDGRKSIGGLARQVVLPPDLTVEDAAQALQNFVNQSPWDEGRVWRIYRRWMAERRAEADGAFVLDDPAFVKQGRHSVGVQRQYSGALGRKTNCQVAVALYHAGPAGCCPLGLRLYLPRGWWQHPHRLDAAGVPEGRRRGQTKGAIALELLDEAQADGWPPGLVTGGAAFGADGEFRAGLAARGWPYLLEAPADVDLAEGETIHPMEGGRVLVGGAGAAAERAASARRAAAEAAAVLMKELGLDHFEGRSWRGFHHHACLVMLAFGFRFFRGCEEERRAAGTVAEQTKDRADASDDPNTADIAVVHAGRNVSVAVHR